MARRTEGRTVDLDPERVARAAASWTASIRRRLRDSYWSLSVNRTSSPVSSSQMMLSPFTSASGS